MPRIYADNAATTKISQTAMKAMISAMENSYGNPSSIHQIGMAANDALQTAREQIARCLGCMPKEIFFTSGGTESDNQAIVSAAMLGAKQNKRHIISTAFEHHAVLHTLRRLKEQGFEIQLLDVIESGAPEALELIGLKDDTAKMYRLLEEMLTPRERQVLIMRYGLYRGREYTQREIAQKLGISRSYISRIEKNALTRLRACFED